MSFTRRQMLKGLTGLVVVGLGAGGAARYWLGKVEDDNAGHDYELIAAPLDVELVPRFKTEAWAFIIQLSAPTGASSQRIERIVFRRLVVQRLGEVLDVFRPRHCLYPFLGHAGYPVQRSGQLPSHGCHAVGVVCQVCRQ